MAAPGAYQHPGVANCVFFGTAPKQVFFDVGDLVDIIDSSSLAVLVAFENVGGAFVLVCKRMKVAVRCSYGLLVESIIGLIIP